MFNKKKKKWFNNKPHYKRGPNDLNPVQQNKPVNKQSPDISNGVREKQGDYSDKNMEYKVNNNFTDFHDNSETLKESPEKTIGEESLLNTANPETGEKKANANDLTIICEICNIPIRNQYTSVRHKTSGLPVHFDCVIRELSKEFYPKLGRFKKIYYIGAGNFAVVKEFYDKRGHLKNYEIVEKIIYEQREK